MLQYSLKHNGSAKMALYWYVGIPMGTNCAQLIADLFLFCYERDFTKDLSSDNQADVNKAFNSTS